MANFEENVEEMVGTSREAVAVATESSDRVQVGDNRRRDGGDGW